MPKKKTQNKEGRPTKYKQDFARLAKIAIEEAGFSINGLCKLFEVKARSTIYMWMEQHEEFSDAIKQGRKNFEGTKIHKALVKRATGFRYTETTRERVSTKGDNGEPSEEKMVITRKVTKMVVPDVSAIKHYQTNMDPENWKDRKGIDVDLPGDFSIKWVVGDKGKK